RAPPPRAPRRPGGGGADRAAGARAPAHRSGRRGRAGACSGPRAGSRGRWRAAPRSSELKRVSVRGSIAAPPRRVSPRGGRRGPVDSAPAMQIGVTIHATDLAMTPPELAREAEVRGFHSLYVPEHTHIPVSRRTPAPTGDAELAEEYKRSLDPYAALAAAAAVTSRIRLGTGVALVAQHDPIALAKQI